MSRFRDPDRLGLAIRRVCITEKEVLRQAPSRFDQYRHPENRLTHALACSRAEGRRLLGRFARWALGTAPPAGRLEIAEGRMIADEYLKSGALTEFAVIPFVEDHPYTCLEGKRLLSLLMD